MRSAGALRQSDIVEFIGTLFEGDLHAKRVLSLSNGTLGVLTSASLAVHAIGQGLAHAQGTLSKHGVKQVDRLLSNQGIEVDALFEQWVPSVIGVRRAMVVALDWTSFARDGHETLVLSMLTRHGQATPLLWRTVEAKSLKGRQTAYEDALLCRLYDTVPEGVAVTVVADRGFADCKLLQLLSEELGFDYVVRLRSQYYVTDAQGERRKAANWVAANGRARTLRDASLTDFQALPVATAVCVQAKDMKEPWCLVSSDREATAKTLLGAAGEALGYDRWLQANTVKRRTHSLFRQGLMLYEHIANWPQERLRPLLEKFAELLQEQRLFRDVFGVI